MTDAFRSEVLRARLLAAGGLVLVAALVILTSISGFSTLVTDGRPVEAELVSIGLQPASRVAGGDKPVLTVRLPDGSVRDVQATWADVNDCQAGRLISLVQRGDALQVGQPGCKKPNFKPNG